MFEKMTGTISKPIVVAIEEAEAARLLFGHVRDVSHSLQTLKENPWSQSVAGHCRVRWNPELAKLGFDLVEAGPRGQPECAGADCIGCGHMAAD